jgi:hypothetical protein
MPREAAGPVAESVMPTLMSCAAAAPANSAGSKVARAAAAVLELNLIVVLDVDG